MPVYDSAFICVMAKCEIVNRKISLTPLRLLSCHTICFLSQCCPTFQFVVLSIALGSQGGYAPKCRTVYETAYTTTYKQQCSTAYERQCATSYEQQCRYVGR